jgi:hypothetical protein
MAPWDNLTLNSGHIVGTSTYTDSGITYYEIAAADADVSVNVLYGDLPADVSGLGTYHAVVELSLDTSLANLFSVKIDSDDLTDEPGDDVLFKVNSGTVTIADDLDAVGTAAVTAGAYAAGSDVVLNKDFVRHMAYKITGGYANADIFSNEDDLVTETNTAIAAAVANLEGQWEDLSQNTYAAAGTTQSDNVLMRIANLKFQKELAKLVADMSSADSDMNLYEYASLSGETHFPIFSALADLSGNSTGISGEVVFGFGESSSDVEALVFHITMKVSDGDLPDGRALTGLMTDRTYKVIVKYSS